MIEEGVIKFECELFDSEPPARELIEDLIFWRNEMFRRKYIGVYDDGIGYGNISKRFEENKFFISGTQTGHKEILSGEHFTFVDDYDIEKNFLKCKGKIKASSESMTHAAIYESGENIGAVIHIHSDILWNKLLNKVPTTSSEAEYGTPEICYEIKRLYKESELKKIKTIVLGGHKDGIIIFGKNLDEAGEIIKNL